ncbi:MAG: hypothetical protein IJP62_08685 [Treponema sp.]|nr:hypothetical protein [Treponema sp.]
MNSIPSIFNQREINRTVLGGKDKMPSVSLNVAVMLLNGGGSHYRIQMLENLSKCGFKSIISFEKTSENYNLENFSHKFPFVKFIVPLEDVTDGDLINIGMSEVDADYVLVLRDTVSFAPDALTARLAEKLLAQKSYCVVPRLICPYSPSFPIVFSPSVRDSMLTVETNATVSDGIPTLYPFDYIGLYNRDTFIHLGGYDYTITSPYWQNLDLSFRAWLWGEKISISTAFNLSYLEEPPSEDTTANLGSSRFYLKNLVPVFVDDHGMIPRSEFWVYLRRSSCGFFETLHQFADAREWVDKNKFRFRRDAAYLVEQWGNL